MSMMNDSSHASPNAASSWHPEQPIQHIPQRQQVRQHRVRLIVVVEGGSDIRFLKRISRILNNHDSHVPDLRILEQSGDILFLPIAGSNFLHWTHRLAGLCLPEFHLLDREVSPLTEERERAVKLINERPGCRAVLTNKRAMENYLCPQAIREARDIDVTFDDQADVPDLVAHIVLARAGGPAWAELPSRGRRRQRALAKK
jgi:hypothetical protein